MIPPPQTRTLGREGFEPAEICLYANEPAKIGVRYMFMDWSDIENLARSAGAPPRILDLEKTLRGKFDLAPGHWLKIGYVNGVPAGYSQYFAITPGHYNPVATVRLFLKMFGTGDSRRVIQGLDIGLKQPGSVWNLALKHAGDVASPRIYGRIERSLLKPLLDDLASAELVQGESRDKYLAWDERVEAGDQIYLSLDPGPVPAAAVDYEDASLNNLSVSPGGFGLEFPPDFKARYLKCRIKPTDVRTEWEVHLPWPWFKKNKGIDSAGELS